ncbi:MAG: dihydrolipoamide acetyltransferase family protein [Planctomycetota bacterium]|jgi:pyruvate dehydrogenase E2 component (dihydrolipoamide acetyltransferase)
MLEFKLPDIGEGTVEGEIVRWIANVGDTVEADQPVVEVMTDKATVELTAPRAGKVVEVRAKAGDVVSVGAVIYVLDDGGSAGSTQSVPATRAAAAGGGARSSAPSATATLERPAASSAATGGSSSGRKPLAAPATRRLARELGVDLGSIAGSGPAGRITTDDVKQAAAGGGAAPAREALAAAPAAASPAPARAAAPVPTGNEPAVRIPFRGIRKATAKAMVRSKFTATHFTYVDEVDVTELYALRKKEKGRLAEQGIKITYLPFIMEATVQALKKHPHLNAELDEAAQEIIQKHYYHLGVSIQGDRGLMVGVVRDADRRSIADIATELNRVVDAARAGKAKPHELSGSTFTITSAGNIGGLFATPIINFPEVAIMGVHQIKKRAVVITNADGEDEIAVRRIMYLSLSVDHRVVDGADAAHFMNDVVALLESPNRLLLGA